MNWSVCFWIAFAVLGVSIAAACIIKRQPAMRSNRFITPFHTAFAGVFLMTLVLLIPVYRSICAETQWPWVKTVLYSIQGTFQVFTVDAESSMILEHVTESVGRIATAYSVTLSMLFVVAPIFTFGFVASLFKNASAYFSLFWHRREELYVFSELNDKSLALAADIKNNHRKVTVVFVNISDGDGKKSDDLIIKAKTISGICFKKDILGVNFNIHSSTKPMFLFAISDDESQNIGQALKLIRLYGNIQNTRLYVFTTSIESELLLSHDQSISMKVRRISRINEVQALINQVLFDQGHNLFKYALPIDNNNKLIHVVIAGLGLHGTEMLKALTWYCQMDGYHLEIDAYDKDELAEERFAALCPELMSPVYNGAFIPGEAEYTIRIHSGIDVETKTFAESIKNLKDVSYAFISLGSDENNVKAAVNLRMLFERRRIKPIIQVVVSNTEKKMALSNLTNYRGQPFNIDCIGDLGSSFSEGVIINSPLENEALQRHMKWGKEEEFWLYGYNYRSSVASAIHMKARAFCGIPGAGKAETDLTAEEKAIIQPLEHRRWNAYMRAEGYVYSGSPDKSSRNDLAKMHHDLVDFSSLTEEEKRKDSSVGSK